MSKNSLRFAAVALALTALFGCVSQQQMLDQQQGTAMETALARGRFELGCPSATAVVLSRDFIQPAVQGGPYMGVEGINRLEYTFGIEGCGQRMTLVAMCQQGSNTCFAANPSTGGGPAR